jgi:hypothetical protein
MREEQVVALSQKIAAEHGIPLSEFKPPLLSYDQGDHRWHVFFSKKQQRSPGDYFEVSVDDTTAGATLIGGR